MENASHDPMTPQRRTIRWISILYLAAVALGLWQVLVPRSNEDGTKMTDLSGKPPAVAVVAVNGVITSGGSGFKPQSADDLARRIHALAEQSDVKAVVLRVNSPGGSVGAVQGVYDAVVALKKSSKTVVASFGDVAASGGYYVSAPADRIFAHPGSLTGSIGVIFQVGNVQDLFKKIGMKVESVKSSEHKDLASPFRAMTENERKILQALIDDTYGQFVRAVAAGRRMDEQKVRQLADGRIYSGNQAKAAGLVDELGGLEAAINRAGELAGIKGKPRVIYDEEPLQKILSFLSKDRAATLWELPAAYGGLRFAYLWDASL